MIKVVQLGLGPIGQRLTRYLDEREGVMITGGVDPDPQKTGKDIGELAGLEKMNVSIVSDLDTCATAEADVAVISTVSSLQKIEPQIKEVADHGLNIVSTCEELSHPWQTDPDCSLRIDKYCKEKGISCLATGVNPGFLMDYLPAILTSVCQKVERIKVERIQDAAPRRKPFRDKIGVGLSESQFEKKRDSIRHVGLKESVYMIADSMNLELDNVCEILVPVVAEKNIKKVEVRRGQVAGVEQLARGYMGEKEVVTLIFKAAVGIEKPHDSVTISGNPDFTSKIEGGINGDIATSAIIVNAVRSVQKLQPGLKTMLDIPAPAYFDRL